MVEKLQSAVVYQTPTSVNGGLLAGSGIVPFVSIGQTPTHSWHCNSEGTTDG